MAKKRKVEERRLYGVNVIDRGYCEVTRESDPNEQWDGDDLYYSHDVVGLKCSNY